KVRPFRSPGSTAKVRPLGSRATANAWQIRPLRTRPTAKVRPLRTRPTTKVAQIRHLWPTTEVGPLRPTTDARQIRPLWPLRPATEVRHPRPFRPTPTAVGQLRRLRGPLARHEGRARRGARDTCAPPGSRLRKRKPRRRNKNGGNSGYSNERLRRHHQPVYR